MRRRASILCAATLAVLAALLLWRPVGDGGRRAGRLDHEPAPGQRIGGRPGAALRRADRGAERLPRPARQLRDQPPAGASGRRSGSEGPRPQGRADLLRSADRIAERRGRRRLGGRLLPQRREGQPGHRRRRDRRRDRVLDGLGRRLADGARQERPVRPRAQRALRLDPARPDLPARPLGLPPLAQVGPPRSARPAQLRDQPGLLQRRRDRRLGAALLPAARLPARPHALDRLPRSRPRRRGGGGATPDDAGLADDRRRDRPDRAAAGRQPRRLRRHRRRLRGGDRRRQDHPRRADLRRLLPRRQPDRRHLRPGQLLRLRPLRADLPVERLLGRPPRRSRRRRLLRPRDDRRHLRARPRPGPPPPRNRRPPTRTPTYPPRRRAAGGSAAGSRPGSPTATATSSA